MQKLRYSDKLRAIENGGEASRLFAEWIEVTQSVDGKLQSRNAGFVHAIAQQQNIRERDAAVKLADQLAEETELAAMFRDWAVGSAGQQPGTAHS
ncbi:MAG TPA: hypothetical protein VFB65_21010 [Pyrinomonadaceae bacterium]|nr:hypothetical protein [Pyrinomonadaceae bacterium]